MSVRIRITVLLAALIMAAAQQVSGQAQPSTTLSPLDLRSVAAGQIATYRVDARLLASPIRTPELEHDLHETVQKNVEDLHHGRFEILHIEPIRGEGDTVAYYDVSIKP